MGEVYWEEKNKGSDSGSESGPGKGLRVGRVEVRTSTLPALIGL